MKENWGLIVEENVKKARGVLENFVEEKREQKGERKEKIKDEKVKDVNHVTKEEQDVKEEDVN